MPENPLDEKGQNELPAGAPNIQTMTTEQVGKLTVQERHKLLLASAPNLQPMTTKRLKELSGLLSEHPVFGPYLEYRNTRFQKKSDQD